MGKCIICGEREATVPDRNQMPTKRKSLCGECHGNRLKNDFVNILLIEKKRRESKAAGE